MKILIDTNIALDVLLNRKPYSEQAAEVFKLAENGYVKAFITSNSITDIVYILRKAYDMETIKRNMFVMFGFIKILNVSSSDILNAFEIHTGDYEDAVIIQCAGRMKADCIVTRDPGDFKGSKVMHMTPGELIRKMGTHIIEKH